MNRKMLSGATLAECLVLALVWGMLAFPGSALAAPRPETKCSDGRDNDKDGLIVFGGSNLGDNACGDPLLVTRVDAVTWTIEARVGFCTFAADEPDHPTNCGAVDPTDPANVCDCACLHEVGKGNKRELTDIDFALPFKITIVAQP